MFLFAIDQLIIWLKSEAMNQKPGCGPMKVSRKLDGFQQETTEIIIKLGYWRRWWKDIGVRIILK